MDTKQIASGEFQRAYGALLDEILRDGTVVTITRNKRDIARLVPCDAVILRPEEYHRLLNPTLGKA